MRKAAQRAEAQVSGEKRTDSSTHRQERGDLHMQEHGTTPDDTSPRVPKSKTQERTQLKGNDYFTLKDNIFILLGLTNT